MACLFLFASYPAFSQDFAFTSQTLEAYRQVLNLDAGAARQSLSQGSTLQDQYVLALSHSLELLLTENSEKFSDWETSFEKWTNRKNNGSADELFFRAEVLLQGAFVYLKFGHEFDAAMQLRKSYIVTRELRKKHPHYLPILKTSGLLQVMIGSVPEKYNWVLDMLDMHGKVSDGLKELDMIRHSSHPLAFEATLWHAFIHGFVLQTPSIGIDELEKQPRFHDNMIALFLAANLHIKNSGSDKALPLIMEMENKIRPEVFPYMSYLKGEILLQKGDYLGSIKAYEFFTTHYKGQNYLKDACYKRGICYWILGNETQAQLFFDMTRSMGKEITEADKYASRAVREKEPPAIPLVKVRYFTDGGFYQEALALLSSMDESDFKTKKDQVEFLYRKARLTHKMNDLIRAVLLYTSVVEKSGDSEWYFAPNACLQLGYIAMAQSRTKEARSFFYRALAYKNHEYKNSIDSKARSALAQLKERR